MDSLDAVATTDTKHDTTRYPWQDPIQFDEMYEKCNKCVTDMAIEWGCSQSTISVWRKKHAREPGRPGGKPRQRSPAEIIQYMTKGRKLDEMASKGITRESLNDIEGYDVYETRNNWQELTYLLLPVIKKREIKPKIWTYQWAPGGESYLMVQFPKRGTKNWKKIKVVPLADVHFGSNAHMAEKFREYVNWIASRDDVFVVIVGDLLENAHGDSCKGIAEYEQEIRPASQVQQMADILSPIAHKILVAHPGNHEDRSRTRDYDPLERLCELLDVPYSYFPVHMDLNWNSYVFSFHIQHGRSGAQSEGGKINSALKVLHNSEHTCFVISAHVHDSKVLQKDRVVRDRVNFRLALKKQYVIICPSFLSFFSSYADKAGYEPGSTGTVNCDLYPDGDYFATA